MPITIAFTVTALVAVTLHWVYLRRVRGVLDAYLASGRNGVGRAVGRMLIRIELFRLLMAVMLFVAGIGVLLGFRPAAYLIAVMPLVGIIASALDLRDNW